MNLPGSLQTSIDKALVTFRNLDNKNRYLVFCAALFLLFLFDYFLIMGPQWKALVSVKTKISTLRQDIERTSDGISKLNEYRQQIRDINEKILLKKSLIKSKDDVVKIFEIISRVAEDNHIRVEKMMPKPEDRQSVLIQDDIDYYRLPISIEGASSFHNFGRFINQLEDNSVFFEVVAFSISNFNSETKTKHAIALTLEIILYDAVDDKGKNE